MDLQAILDAPSSSHSSSSSSSSTAAFHYPSHNQRERPHPPPPQPHSNDLHSPKQDQSSEELSDISSACGNDGGTATLFVRQTSSLSFRESYRCRSYEEEEEEEDGVSNIGLSKARGGTTNLELERILREMEIVDDDDDDDDEDVVDIAANVETIKDRVGTMRSENVVHATTESDILQSILNEDDEDDDDYDYENGSKNDNDASFDRGKYTKYSSSMSDGASSCHLAFREGQYYHHHPHHTTNSSFADLSMLSASQANTIPLSHSMEVDAILHSVRDGDGDDDDDGSYDDHMYRNSSFLKYHRRMLSINTSSDKDRDDDDAEEEDEDDGIALNFNFSKGNFLKSDYRMDSSIDFDSNMMSAQYPLSRHREVSQQEDDANRPYGKEVYVHDNRFGKSTLLEGEQMSLKECTATFLHRHNAKTTHEAKEKVTTTDKGDIATDNSISSTLSEDQQNARISELCLHQAELYERRLLKPNTRNLVSPLTVKRRMKPKVTLMSKSRMSGQPSSSIMQSQQQSSQSQQQQQQPRFGFSGGIIQLKSMADLGSHIVKSEAQQTQLPSQKLPRGSGIRNGQTLGGLPTALAVNSKFIAVGTQRGTVWVFDLFEQLKMTLCAEESGAPNKIGTSVTSIDLPIHGDYLLAGYGSGAIVLWDVIKGSVLKSMNDLHSSPITMLRLTSFPIAYTGGNDNDIGAVSVDAGGLVNKIVLSKGMLWSSYSVETECLLDGTAGQILSMDTLPPLDVTQYSEGGREYHPSAYKIVLIALSSDRSSFAVSVVPKVSVLHRWARPAPERIDPSVGAADDRLSEVSSIYASTYASTYANSSLADQNVSGQPEKLPFLPCLSWGWGLVSGGNNSVTPILARSWGCCIQFLCANFPPRDENDADHDDGTIHWPAFGLHDEFDASSPVVALNWLGTRSLVYLTLTNEFTIIDTVIMTMQERLDFSGMKLVYAEFALSRPKRPESSLCTTFMNSIRSNDNRLLVLCQEDVKQITVLGIRQQIASLEDGGQWLEALALALDHYESTVQSQEDRQRGTLKDAMSLANDSLLTADEIWMAEILVRYLLLAIDNAPEPEMISSNKRLNLAHSHFEMLSGVCLEYCVVMKRLDLLFGPIFRCFYEARYINVFLDVMETYILNDRLRYIAPEAMVLFVAHCKDMKDLSMVERCLLHMDCSLMDFDSILTLLKKNALYTGLIHVYNTGLDDFSSPLEVLFDAIFDSINTSNCIHGDRRKEGVLTSKFEQYGYKALLYLKCCFSGKAFPKGNVICPEDRIHTLRSEIFEVLFRQSVVVPQQHAHGLATARLHGIRASSYPYLRALILADTRTFLDCLSIVLDDPEAAFAETANIDIIGSWDVEYGTDNDRDRSFGPGQNGSSDRDRIVLIDRQHLVNILSSIIMTEDLFSFDNHFGARESSQVTAKAKNAFLDFLGKYLQRGVFTAPRYLTAEVMTRLCSKKDTSEDQILSLLRSLPRSSYELDEILYTVEKAQMTRSALFLHQSGVSRTVDRASMSDKCQYYFNRSIDCFLQDRDVEFQKGVFGFCRKECCGVRSLETDDQPKSESEISSSVLRRVLLRRLSELAALDAVQTAQLVAELFVEDIDIIVSSFQGIDSGRLQYSFLHAIIAELPKVDAVAAQELGANLTLEHQHMYLSLMARFQPDLVYSYLASNRNYRLEDALKLCQDRRITDASAYLLERMGDVSGALKLMLQTFDARMIGLKNVLQESAPASGSRVNNVSSIKASLHNNDAAEKELAGAKQTLVAVLDLCERNRHDHLALDNEHNERGPLLWFHVLDRLISAKHLLGASKKASEYHSAVISTVLSELLLMTMQRMTHHVSHFDLMHKISRDHAGSDLGEFREMLVSMLKTYSSELDVCSNAVNVMHYDIRKLSLQRKNLKVRGSFIQECPIPLPKNGAVEIHPSGTYKIIADPRITYHRNTVIHNNSACVLRRRRTNDKQQRTIFRGSMWHWKGGQERKKIDLMTASERQFSSGRGLEIGYSFDDYTLRQVGALSEAQNVGSLS
ncbi:hypothetical protein HJC23_011929 [Cyclotella cryptica]|uniref:Vacuolar protein sorting-associated protein 8 central domain-containing protein n=1 Tax=Cyclotella cryptica TaxID=29204 RepID=A0ABD3QX30_9STRA|eukprot:CCRYP_002966-RA/>CCRYP_002966-RA protein AED:0.01 eAED:0.01 QI:118/1/1/1/1/1/3/852/2012